MKERTARSPCGVTGTSREADTALAPPPAARGVPSTGIYGALMGSRGVRGCAWAARSGPVRGPSPRGAVPRRPAAAAGERRRPRYFWRGKSGDPTSSFLSLVSDPVL